MLRNNYHNHGLDLLRGICGYFVAICHYQWLVKKINHYEYISILFVEFFFILSGFVLAPQLIKIIYEKKNMITFFHRRWMRTIPLYLLSLLLVSIITNNLFNKDFFLYLFFLNKTLPNLLDNDYYSVAWSLAVEEYFYIIFPLLIILFFNSNNYKKNSVLLLIFLSLLIFILSFFVDKNFFRTGTFLRIDTILCGFLLAIFLIEKKINIYYILIGIVLLCILYFYYYILGFYKSETFFSKIFFISLLKLIAIFTLLLFYKIDLGIYFSWFTKLIANQTYSIYLLHLPLIYIINSDNNLSLNLLQFCLFLFFISTIVFYFFEKPILFLRPKYENN